MRINYFQLDRESSINAPLIIHNSKIHYPDGYEIFVNEGKFEKKENQRIAFIMIQDYGPHTILITK